MSNNRFINKSKWKKILICLLIIIICACIGYILSVNIANNENDLSKKREEIVLNRVMKETQGVIYNINDFWEDECVCTLIKKNGKKYLYGCDLKGTAYVSGNGNPNQIKKLHIYAVYNETIEDIVTFNDYFLAENYLFK